MEENSRCKKIFVPASASEQERRYARAANVTVLYGKGLDLRYAAAIGRTRPDAQATIDRTAQQAFAIHHCFIIIPKVAATQGEEGNVWGD